MCACGPLCLGASAEFRLRGAVSGFPNSGRFFAVLLLQCQTGPLFGQIGLESRGLVLNQHPSRLEDTSRNMTITNAPVITDNYDGEDFTFLATFSPDLEKF